ncbi:MAG: aminopeptidase N, partial [Rhodobacteraceae bacterium]|nr:aminopeptidase N [Paracoccaceae bacterium]
ASMRWDENIYQREYDLDVFNIVAVDDFNMGAMENKGLNIFNSACVLASPTTSTDKDFERIEAIIAHEYFHNWTGNRITCRDWFQLCLKEGLTVFRDAQFTSDMRSAPVKRIEDVIQLRAIQFSEDGGPLAHPVRPDSFIEINNFYTATVYEKGAELIGMLKTLVGDQAYYKALALYFQRHDGDAATIEDWLQVFEDSTGRDLSQFKNWYTQAGTPQVSVTENYEKGIFQLTFSQKTPATPGQIEKDPKVIPIALGLLSPCGQELLPTQILELSQPQQSFTFASAERPIASILREFSAPILLKHTQNDAIKAFLLAHDTDPFNKWQAGRTLAVESLKELAQHNQAPALEFLDALQAVASDDALDPAFRALVLGLPSQDEIARSLYADGLTPDPQRIFDALETLHQTLAQHLQDIWPHLYAAHQIQEPYAPNAQQSNARALANRALVYLTRIDAGDAAKKQFDTANNMTQQQAALSALLSVEKGAEQAQAFYDQWKEDRLVIDKWFALQVAFAPPEKAAIIAKSLTQHEDFNWKNPNRFRAVFGSLAGNMAGFHHLSGQGYELMVQWLSRLDKINPQTTARMCGAFKTWRQFDTGRQAMLKPLLQNMLEMDGLSRDSREMLSRIVND